MADPKAEISKILQDQRQSIDELHHKLAAVAGCDKQRLASAVAKFKAAHQVFSDDAQACVGF